MEREAAMARDAFVARFGGVYEHSPWIAERAWDAEGAEIGARGAAGLATALSAQFNTASPSERLGVLRAHPDLAGKLAAARRLTAESTAEQAAAGLDALTDEERARFQQLNAAYTERFGHPFIIAVRDYTKAEILATFEARLANGAEEEFETACAQVDRIARLRLNALAEEPSARRYHSPVGGLPGQSQLMTGRAIFTEAYAVLPAGTMRDITASRLPLWTGTRCWILARPMTGFAETFSQYAMELDAGGGSDSPESVPEAEGALFVTSGALMLTVDGVAHEIEPGGFAYLPPGANWAVRATGPSPASFQWIRKRYQPVDGLPAPAFFTARDRDIDPISMPDTQGRWATSRFMDPDDLAHDMHVNIVTFEPGAVIPFEETHVMEHGLYVLEGKAVYKLNADWVEVEAGDFLWLRAFCPQACYAGGPGPFRYLLYKDVNRHAELSL